METERGMWIGGYEEGKKIKLLMNQIVRMILFIDFFSHKEDRAVDQVRSYACENGDHKIHGNHL